MSLPGHLKALINEETRTALWESKDVKRVVLESRLRLINEALEINEADWLDRARKWFMNKAYGAEQGAKDLGRKALVNPQAIVDDPRKAMGVVQKSLAGAKKAVASFKQDALRSSTAINKLQDAVLEVFGKMMTLADDLPPQERGKLEREVMQVVGQFYLAMIEEKNRIETYLSALAREVGQEGYNLGRSAQAMAGYAPEAKPRVQGSQVVEPEMAGSPALAGARA